MTKSNSQLSQHNCSYLHLTAQLILDYSSTSSLFFTTSLPSLLFLLRKFYTQPFHYVRSWDSFAGIAATLRAGHKRNRGTIVTRDKRWIWLVFRTSRQGMGPTKTSTQWVPGSLYPEITRPRADADRSHHLMSKLRMNAATSPIRHMLSWLQRDVLYFRSQYVHCCRRGLTFY